MRKSFTEVGLPDDHKVLTLAYHQPSGTLISHVEPVKEVTPQKRLYFRWAIDTYYQPVGDFPEGISINNFLLDAARPSLYFLTGAWKAMSGGLAVGNWDALYRFDLEGHRCERLTRREDLLPLEGYEKVWLCDLLGVSSDGCSLFCKAGLEKQDHGGIRADYWVVKLDLGSLRLEKITELSAVFA